MLIDYVRRAKSLIFQHGLDQSLGLAYPGPTAGMIVGWVRSFELRYVRGGVSEGRIRIDFREWSASDKGMPCSLVHGVT